MGQMIQDQLIAPQDLRVFRDGSNNLNCEIEGRGTWRKIAVRRAFPYSDPGHFISLVLSDEHIGIIGDLEDLDAESRGHLKDALAKRYHIPEVTRILSVREVHSTAVWTVETDRGPREFVVRDRHNFRRIKGGNRIIIDVDGNRFLISRDRHMDAESHKLLDMHG